jgi:hypothetical protein
MTVCIVCLCSVFNRNLSICESEQTFSKGDTVWAVRKNTRSHDSQPQQGEQTNTVKDVNPPPECPFHKKPQAVEPAKDVSPPPECPFHNKQQSPASTETPPSSAGASAGKCPFTGNTQKAASQQEVADDPKDFSKATCPFIANKHHSEAQAHNFPVFVGCCEAVEATVVSVHRESKPYYYTLLLKKDGTNVEIHTEGSRYVYVMLVEIVGWFCSCCMQ